MVSKLHRSWHRKLSQDWQKRGVLEYCELRLKGCQGTYGLAPAHSKDRDEIRTEAEYREVVAACNFCHFAADRQMSKEDRLKLFKEIIANREQIESTA